MGKGADRHEKGVKSAILIQDYLKYSIIQENLHFLTINTFCNFTDLTPIDLQFF